MTSEHGTGPPQDSGRVLVVDDDPGIGALFTRILTHDGYVVHVAVDAEAALAGVATHNPDVIPRDGMFRGADCLPVLHRGGLMHDTAMLAISPTVLLKPGPLAADEFAIVKSHTVIGDDLCRNLRTLQAVRPIVRHHHERLDGSGYPDGLQGI